MEQLDTFQTLLIASSLDGGRDIPRGLIENLLKYVTPLPNVHLDNFVLSKKIDFIVDEVTAVALSPTNKYAFAGLLSGSMFLVNLEKGDRFLFAEAHRSMINSVDVSDTGIVVSGSDDGTAKVWEVRTLKCTKTLKEHLAAVNIVKLSAKGDRVFTGSVDKTIIMWRLDGILVRHFVESDSRVLSLDVFNDNNRLLSTAYRSLIVWNVRTERRISVIPMAGDEMGTVNSVKISPDQSVVAVAWGDFRIKLLSPVNFEVIRTITGVQHVTKILFDPSGSQLFLAKSANSHAAVLDIETGKVVRYFSPREQDKWGAEKGIALSQDGSKMAIIDSKYAFSVYSHVSAFLTNFNTLQVSQIAARKTEDEGVVLPRAIVDVIGKYNVDLLKKN